MAKERIVWADWTEPNRQGKGRTMRNVIANTGNSFLRTAAAVLAVGALVPSAQAVTVLSSDNGVVFQDTFANDTLGALPTIVAPDVGDGYTHLAGNLATVDIENDPGGVLGKVLNVGHDGASLGVIELSFPAQAGSVIESSFRAKVTDPGNGGSLGVAYRNAGAYVASGYTYPHAIYLLTGSWMEDQGGLTLPAGITRDDVVVGYYINGPYQFATAGGDAAAARVDGGAGRWIDVTLTQTAAVGSQPVFTLNGTILDPIPMSSSASSIDGLAFRNNGASLSQAYVAGLPTPFAGTMVVIR